MNNTFDYNRFCKVVWKDFRNIWPAFGTTMLILVSLPLAVWLLQLAINGDAVMPTIVREFLIGGIVTLAAIMAPSRLYRTCNLRGEGIYFAMLPASKAEKFWSMALHCFVVVPLMMLVACFVLDMLLWLLPIGSFRDPVWDGGIIALMVENNMPFSGNFTYWLSVVLGTFTTISVFFFTNTVFKSHKVLHTILWMWLIYFVLSLVMIPLGIGFVNSPSAVDWLRDIAERLNYMEGQQIFNWWMGIGIAWNVLVTALFGFLAWRRLRRMAY